MSFDERQIADEIQRKNSLRKISSNSSFFSSVVRRRNGKLHRKSELLLERTQPNGKTFDDDHSGLGEMFDAHRSPIHRSHERISSGEEKIFFQHGEFRRIFFSSFRIFRRLNIRCASIYKNCRTTIVRFNEIRKHFCISSGVTKIYENFIRKSRKKFNTWGFVLFDVLRSNDRGKRGDVFSLVQERLNISLSINEKLDDNVRQLKRKLILYENDSKRLKNEVANTVSDKRIRAELALVRFTVEFGSRKFFALFFFFQDDFQRTRIDETISRRSHRRSWTTTWNVDRKHSRTETTEIETRTNLRNFSGEILREISRVFRFSFVKNRITFTIPIWCTTNITITGKIFESFERRSPI